MRPTQDGRNPDGTEQLAEYLTGLDLGLAAGETPLSRVTVYRGELGVRFTIHDRDGRPVQTITEDELAAAASVDERTLLSRLNAAVKRTDRMSCTDCGEALLEGEDGLCSPCEGKAIRELRGLAADLDSGT